MPRLNNKGVATTGYMVSWFDDERYLKNERHTGDLRVVLSDGTVLHDAVEGGPFYAGASKWVAEVHGGVMWEGQIIPGAALTDYCDPIGPDGTLAIKRQRNSFGPWGFVDGPDFGGDCRSVTNLGEGKALWINPDWSLGANWGCRYIGTKCYSYRLKGEDFLFQSSETGELVFNGKVIGPSGNYYRPDFMRIDGLWYIVWSSVEGEPADKFQFVKLSDVALDRKPAFKTSIPTPIPPPIVEVPPVTVEQPKLEIDGKPIVEAIRKHYTEWNDQANASFLLELLGAFKGSKLYKKPGGENVKLPDGTLVSRDILIIEPFYIDVLGDAENTGTPAWSPNFPAEHPENFYVPSGSIPTTPPVQPPSQPSNGVSRDEVAKMIAESINNLTDHLRVVLEAIQKDIKTIDQHNQIIHQVLDGVVNRLKEEVSTSRSFGHSHKVQILK